MRYARKVIAYGYLLITLLIGGIAYTWHYEWQEVEVLESDNRQIDELRKEINDVHIQLIEFSLLGETILEWDNEDLEYYHTQRMVIDSMLCRFKMTCPAERIDSVRHLLEDKERQMYQIVQVFEQQQVINDKITRQVPVIMQKSVQEQPKKPKRKGFLGIFGKKEKVKPTVSTTVLHSFNRNIIAEQQAQSRCLSEHADSLAERNAELNRQLQGLIRQIDGKVQTDLQKREAEITTMRECSFIQIGGLTGFVILLLFASYIVIHRNFKRIKQYKQKTEDLIEQLRKSIHQNEVLIASRKKVVYTIAHELRTPLSAIRVYAEMIEKDKTSSTHIRHAEIIGDASGRIAGMVDTLLNFFRLDCGKEIVHPLPIRLKSITETLEVEFMPQMVKKRLMFEVVNEANEVVMGDRNVILRIGSNLLSNALKFTQKGSVKLTAKYLRGKFILAVDDTGTGIGKDKLEQIFNPFERLGNAATQDGFGLGLAIVKSLVELMEGTITVESVPEMGSRFTVALPLVKAEHVESKTSSYAIPHHLSGCSVLSIDNDRMLLDILHDMFEQSGVHSEICTDMSQLTEKLRGNRYDLLTTDLKMSDISGYEVLELLRSSDIGNSRTVPIMAITGSGSITEEELKQTGFSAVLFKPFSIEELLIAMEQCIGENKTSFIDLTPLFAYGSRREKLECLINETEKEMAGIKEAVNDGDNEKTESWIHHIRSSWMLIRAEQPLQELYEALHGGQASEVIQVSIGKVLEQGEKIIRLARQELEKETWEEL